MISYSDEQKEIIRNYNSKKILTIKFLDDDSYEDINSDRIYWESLKLIESLCDNDNLIFGSCESSEMQIQVADLPLDVKNHEIQLDLKVDNILVPLGIFFIDNVEKATDKRYKKLTCYDRMYYMQTNVIEWYNSIFPTIEATMTLKAFRDSFFEYIGFEQADIILINDNMVIHKTIDATELSGLDVIKAICEINGAFGHFNRYGVFQYVYLSNYAVYPSETLYPRDDLYPGGGNIENVSNAYYIPPSEQNDYIVRNINKLQIRQEDGDIGAIVTASNYTNEEANSYIVNSNFLVYGQSAEELKNIANNLSTKIFGISYTPNKTNTVAMPYMEVGDGFYVDSVKTPFTSYILKRTLSGIQGMRDLWEAEGEEFQPEIVSNSNQEIMQLQSRVNKLSITVDGFNAEIKKISTTLESVPTRTEMTTAINASAEGLDIEISQKVNNDSIIASINASAESISINASKINLTGYVTFSNLTDNQTIISGDNIKTGTISAERINGNNLKITGTNAIVQIGAEGVGNDNYIYMVSTTSNNFAHLDSGIIAVVSTNGAFSATGDGGIVYTYGDENCFVFNCIDDKAVISTAKEEMIITAPTLTINNVVSYGSYSFINGGTIGYNGATDRIASNKTFEAPNLVVTNGIDVNTLGVLANLNCNKAIFNGRVYADKYATYVTDKGWCYLSDLLRDIVDRLGLTIPSLPAE